MRPDAAVYRPDQIEQIAHEIPVSSIASFPVVTFPGSLRCDDAWAQMRPEALDIDVALVEAAEFPQAMIVKRDSSWAESPRPLSDHAQIPPAEVCVAWRESLQVSLRALGRSSYLLCIDHDQVKGIVTLADLRKPAASLLAFGTILSFESALSLLFPSLTDRRWISHLGKRARRRVEKEIAARKASGTFISEEECLSMTDKLSVSRRLVTKRVKISGVQWDKLTGRMAHIRNDLAHGRTLLSSHRDPLQILLDLEALEELSRKLWKLVDDREDVWDAYERTECLVRTSSGLRPLFDARGELPNRFWMLSAQNPYERVLSDELNRRRHEALVSELSRHDVFLTEGVGRAPGGDGWSEDMAIAAGIDRDIACHISWLFGQRSVFEISGDVFRVVEVATKNLRRERSLDRS